MFIQRWGECERPQMPAAAELQMRSHGVKMKVNFCRCLTPLPISPRWDGCREKTNEQTENMKIHTNGDDDKWTKAPLSYGSETISHLPSSTEWLLLHSVWRHRWGGAGQRQAVGGVDDRNGVASPRGGGLVQLEGGLLSVIGGRNKGRRRGVQRESRRHLLGVLRRRRVRRVAGQR